MMDQNEMDADLMKKFAMAQQAMEQYENAKRAKEQQMMAQNTIYQAQQEEDPQEESEQLPSEQNLVDAQTEELTDEEISHYVGAIENDKKLKAFLLSQIGASKKCLTKLSYKGIKQLKDEFNIEIENRYVNEKTKNSIYKAKKEALCAFVNTHPWLKIDDQKPITGLTYWLTMYRMQTTDDKIIVIRANGSIDVVDK